MYPGSVRQYLAKIGRRGGQRSRRHLDSETARKMVRLREAKRAFRTFYTECFWSYDPNYKVTQNDIVWVGQQLMKHGGRRAWQAGAKLCH